MSSEGSSGISQFGLYRTIDARTEEFLRLSRRRQIRQGCACAAVSTAVTVTVVVTVLLVYEYSIIAGSSKNKSYVTKSTWLGFINDSADTPFDAKYSKPKLNFDKTTLKLLPILLKALKQNVFLDEAIEDYTSVNPIYEPSEATEQYEKNIFSDPRNWFKAPHSRLYAIEFKTSPIVYYHSAMRNSEYMSKIRKIRDYQRILNYFDKMVNDKFTYGPNQNLMKRELPTRRPPVVSTTPMKKQNKIKDKHRTLSYKKYIKRPVTTTESRNCKCPLKLGEILNKLKANVNQLMPYTKLSLPKLCDKNKPIQLIKSKPKIIRKMKTTKHTTLKPKTVVTTPNLIQIIKASTMKMEINSSNEIKQSVSNFGSQHNMIRLPLDYNIKSNIKIDSIENIIDNYEKHTTIKNYIEPTESESIKLTTTLPMTPVRTKIENFTYRRLKQNYSNSNANVDPDKIKSNFFTSNEEYDEYFVTTPKTSTNLDILETQSLKLVKDKMNNPENNPKKLKTKLSEVLSKNVKQAPGDIQGPKLIPIQKYKFKDFSVGNRIDNIFYKFTHNKPYPDVIKEKIKSSETQRLNEAYNFDHVNHNDHFLNYDDRITDDYSPEENRVIQMNTQEGQPHTNHKTTVLPKHKAKEALSNEESVSPMTNSMSPRARPLYLEIQRNDWKQDDNRDFDFTADNNIYDAPNF